MSKRIVFSHPYQRLLPSLTRPANLAVSTWCVPFEIVQQEAMHCQNLTLMTLLGFASSSKQSTIPLARPTILPNLADTDSRPPSKSYPYSSPLKPPSQNTL